MIFDAFGKALGQIDDRRFRKVLLIGVALTLILLAAATACLLLIIQWLVGDTVSFWFIGEVQWLDDLLSWGGLALMVVLSVFLMVPVASAITSMFLDDVAQAVEDKHYTHLPKIKGISIGEGLKDSVNFLGILIFANLLALVLYALFTPLAPFIFWALNGYLLGMEYFQLAAMRRLGRVEARKMRRKHRMTVWAAGTLMAMPLSVPLINLVIPILGAATFTHIFHRLNASDAAKNCHYPTG